MSDTDFEDKDSLLESVVVEASRSYLKEAIDCFEAGAYRASAVMLSCAVFEDIRLKAESFAQYDTWCNDFRIHVEAKRGEQESYESNVIEKVKSSKIFSPEQRSALLRIWKTRNQAAHPSGVPVSRLQVADLIRAGVSNFLAKTELLGNESVEILLAELEEVDLFPEAQIEQARLIAPAILKTIHPNAFFQLANKIVEDIRKERGGRFVHNGRNFLISMASTGARTHIAALTTALFSKSTPRSNENWVLEIVARAPGILAGIERRKLPAADASLAAICASIPEDSDKSFELEGLFAKLVDGLDADFLTSGFGGTLDALLAHVWHRAVVAKSLGKSERLKFLTLYTIHDRMESADDAGRFVDMVLRSRLDDVFAKSITDHEAFVTVAQICQAAIHRNTSCRDLTSSGFNKLPALRAKAIKLISTSPVEAEATQASYNGYWELQDTIQCLDAASDLSVA